MNIIGTFLLIGALSLCTYASVKDIGFNIIQNRILVIYAICAILVDFLAYGIVARGLATHFLLNVAVTIVLSLVLFYSHVWAGGDCKLMCVLALLYPADNYLYYTNTRLTLFFAIALGFLFGYLYLVISSLFVMIRDKIAVTGACLIDGIKKSLQSYVQVAVYLVAAHFLLNLLCTEYRSTPVLIQIGVSLVLSWIIGECHILKSRSLIAAFAVLDVLIALWTGYLPNKSDLTHYLVVLLAVVVRLIASQQNYKCIPTAEVKKGMILSTATTALFALSKVNGLPGLSTEDLRSRLTEAEVESVHKWADSSLGQANVTIVKKIPFAVFISLGYFAYYIAWRILISGI